MPARHAQCFGGVEGVVMGFTVAGTPCCRYRAMKRMSGNEFEGEASCYLAVGRVLEDAVLGMHIPIPSVEIRTT
jgi:hypothetical protein